MWQKLSIPKRLEYHNDVSTNKYVRSNTKEYEKI